MALALQPAATTSLALANVGCSTEAPRTSKLAAPIMLLTGHEGEVSALDFSGNGEWLCSGSYDRTINIWNVGSGECCNIMVLKGHKNAVLETKWSADSRSVYSCSADKSVCIWDTESGARTARLRRHRACVTCLDRTREGRDLVISGDDAGIVYIWDPRQSNSAASPTQIDTRLPVTGLQVGHDGTSVFTASVDTLLRVWDIRMAGKSEAVLQLRGHSDTVVGLRLGPDGTRLLSNALDDTLRVWDVRPSTRGERCERIFYGAPHDAGRRLVRPCWSRHGRYIACGSGDRTVLIWDAATGRVLYKLPGHRAAVPAVSWHPTAPIVASGSADRTVYLGELNLR